MRGNWDHTVPPRPPLSIPDLSRHADFSCFTLFITYRVSQDPLRTGKPQSYEGFTRPTKLRVIRQKDPAEQIPFPRSVSPLDENSSISTCSSSEAPQSCLTNDIGHDADVAPQEGVFNRCFTFLKHVGVKLMMPPYTIDGELDYVARKHGYVNSVSPRFCTWTRDLVER